MAIAYKRCFMVIKKLYSCRSFPVDLDNIKINHIETKMDLVDPA